MLFRHSTLLPSLHQNLMLIAFARFVLWGLAEVLILVNLLWLHLPFNAPVAQGILALYAASGIVSFVQAKTSRELPPGAILMHLVLDVSIMTGLFHVAGGAANPFVSILLFPLTVSAAILPSRFTWLMVILTLISYGSLFLPDFGAAEPMMDHSQHTMTPETQSVFSLHIVGMWFNFAISAVLISFFVVKMRQQIQTQQEKINQHREKSLRDEQLLGIATQAASAAHHISTPLATMAVIINDLKSDPLSAPFNEDLNLLTAQVENCKQVLGNLRYRDNDLASISLEQFIAQLVDEFRLMRPDAVLETDIKADNTNHISSDPSLRMALLNVLNNSADASPGNIQLNSYVEKSLIHFRIRDFGAGLPEQFSTNPHEDKISTPVHSTKPEGLGLGLFLSHATLDLHQGHITQENTGEQGTMTHITLPIWHQPDEKKTDD